MAGVRMTPYANMGKKNKQFLPLACYSTRWNIEISYYESKTFWSLEEYRVRSRKGIERLINLECIAYSAMTLLPYSDETFSCYQSVSAQETKPLFQGLHHFFKRKSNDLPFLCKYYYQPTNTERKIIAYGYYSLFTLFDSVSLPAKLLADQLRMQIHPH